jgi:hypothetical protein
MNTSPSDSLLPRSAPGFVLVAALAAFMLFLGVRGFLDPIGAAHGFGADLAAAADGFYLHVKADRDLAIGLLLVALLAYRRLTPLVLAVATLFVAPIIDGTLVALHGRLGYALAVHGSAVAYGAITIAVLLRAAKRVSRSATLLPS